MARLQHLARISVAVAAPSPTVLTLLAAFDALHRDDPMTLLEFAEAAWEVARDRWHEPPSPAVEAMLTDILDDVSSMRMTA